MSTSEASLPGATGVTVHGSYQQAACVRHSCRLGSHLNQILPHNLHSNPWRQWVLLLGTSGTSNHYTGLVAGLSKKIIFLSDAPRFLKEHCFCKFPRIRPIPTPSPRRPDFDPRSIHVSFGADKVAMGKVFLPVLRFSPVRIIQHLLRMHLHLRVAPTGRTNRLNRETFQKAVLDRKSAGIA